LSPAKIGRATVIDPIERHLEVIVETDQLSLAIGKKGQNVRLAAKLTGWKIDIKSDEEKRAEIEDQMAQMAARTPLGELPGLTASVLQKLMDAGIETIEQLADTPIAELTDIKGVGPKSAEKIIASVKDYYMQFSEGVSPEEAVKEDSEVVSPSAEIAEVESQAVSENTELAAGSDVNSSQDMEREHEISPNANETKEEE